MRETLSPKNLTAKAGLRGGGRGGGVPGLGAGAAALAGMRVGAWVRAGVPKEECRNPDGLGGKEKEGGAPASLRKPQSIPCIAPRPPESPRPPPASPPKSLQRCAQGAHGDRRWVPPGGAASLPLTGDAGGTGDAGDAGAYLGGPAAASRRCCPLLPAAPGGAGGGAELPAVWEGPAGRPQQIRAGRRHRGSAPSPAVIFFWGGRVRGGPWFWQPGLKPIPSPPAPQHPGCGLGCWG